MIPEKKQLFKKLNCNIPTIAIILFLTLFLNTQKASAQITNGSMTEASVCSSCPPSGWTSIPSSASYCYASSSGRATSDIFDNVTSITTLPADLRSSLSPDGGTLVSGVSSYKNNGQSVFDEGIEQTITTVANQMYRIDFYQSVIGQLNNFGVLQNAGDGAWRVYIDEQLQGESTAISSTTTQAGFPDNTWSSASIYFIASGTSTKISFLPQRQTATGARMGLDGVSITTVSSCSAPSAPTGSASQTVCNMGTVAELSATGSTIKWYTASSGGSPLASSTVLTNGTKYYASQSVSGCESATRLEVTATVSPPISAPTGNSSETFCTGAKIHHLIAKLTGTDIKIYFSNSSSSPYNINSTLATHTYYASQTVNGCESLRLAIPVTVNTIPSAPTGNTAQSFCSVDSPTVADLTATGTNIQWYSSSSGGSALLSSFSLTNGTKYYASQTVTSCDSTSRLEVTATVTNPTAPTGSASQTFCSVDSPTVADLTATGTNIQWYAASSGGSALASSVSLTNGTKYYASQTINGCESTTRFEVTATINTTPSAPTGNATQNLCTEYNPKVSSLSAIGTAVKWYASSSGGSPLATSTSLTNGTYFASQTVTGCESTTRFAVTVTIASCCRSGSDAPKFN